MGYCVVNEIKMAFSIHNYRYSTSQKTGIVEDVTSYSQNLIGGKNVYYIDVKMIPIHLKNLILYHYQNYPILKYLHNIEIIYIQHHYYY